MTETEVVTDATGTEDGEFILFIVVVIAAILLGYRNKDKIIGWFNDAIAKLK